MFQMLYPNVTQKVGMNMLQNGIISIPMLAYKKKIIQGQCEKGWMRDRQAELPACMQKGVSYGPVNTVAVGRTERQRERRDA